MTPEQVSELLDGMAKLDQRVASALASVQSAAELITRWHTALSAIPATTASGWDARRVALDYYRDGGEARYGALDTRHVLAAWSAHGARQLERDTDPLPVADADQVTEWRAELLEHRQRVAVGAAPAEPLPVDAAAIRPTPAARAIASAGRPMPPEARALVLAARRRPRTIAPDRPCPACGAASGVPCRTTKRGRPMAGVHGSRTS